MYKEYDNTLSHKEEPETHDQETLGEAFDRVMDKLSQEDQDIVLAVIGIAVDSDAMKQSDEDEKKIEHNVKEDTTTRKPKMKEILMSDDIEILIRNALREDIGTGDITTASTVSPNAVITGNYVMKDDGVVCGIDIVRRVFDAIGSDVEYTPKASDGDFVKRGDVIATVSGNAVAILSGERVGLNLLQHLSGIATCTRKAVDSVAGTKVRITETRKTTPGLRILEKYAVRIGGGASHRFGLSDGILIKDNHIVAAGGITAAIKSARLRAPHTLKIEVETETLDQVREAVAAGADIIMLDNMDCAMMKEAVAIIAGRAITEASGNMGRRDLMEVAETGVDVISIGALTHSVKALDISLKFISLKN